MPGQPLYKSIAQDLIQKIENGTYIKGDRLPTEAKLSQKYNVSRITIRQALDILIARDYVKKVQGSGTHVTYFKYNAILKRSAQIRSFTKEMQSISRVPSSKVIKFELTFADKQLAVDLNLQEQDPVFYYERILYGDEHPYCYETGYMPYSFFPDLTVDDLLHSKNHYIECKKQIPIVYSHQVVHAILADENLHRHLQVDVNFPLLEVFHISYTEQGVPLEKVCNIFNSELYHAHFVKTR